MEFLPDHSDDRNQELIPREPAYIKDRGQNAPYLTLNPMEDQGGEPLSLRPGVLLRKYWLLLGFLLIVGAAAGFVSVVLSSPMYKTRLLLEVQNSSGLLSKNGTGGQATDEVDIETQVNILHSSGFLKRGSDRMQADSVPLAPTGRDLFSR